MNAARARIDSATTRQIADLKAGRTTFRRELSLSPVFFFEETWDRQGLARLIMAAQAAFEAATGHKLPHNTANWGSWVGEAWGKNHPLRRSEWDPVAEAAKFAGFLRSAPDFPVLTRAIIRTTSSRGIHSPHTTTNWVKVAQRFSPGAAERFLRAVRARASQILGELGEPSWGALGLCLEEGPRRVGKAAVWVAAMTLTGFVPTGYAKARLALAKVARPVGSVQFEEDGVVSWGPAEPIWEMKGDLVYRRAWFVTDPRRVVSGFVVVSEHGSFHIEEPQLCYWDSSRLKWSYPDRPEKLAWLKARRAFRVRADLLKETDLPDLCRVSILVTRDDSFAAGNCREGTERFLEARGWKSRWAVPAHWLVVSGNPLAVNAARQAAYRVRALLE